MQSPKEKQDNKPKSTSKNSSTEKSRYQLTDWGFVETAFGPDGKDNSRKLKKGTPRYMPPELTGADKLNIEQFKKCDIYSLGATLFDIYLSQKGERPQDLRAAIAKLQAGGYVDRAQSVEELNFLLFIKDLTAKRPEKRPTATEVLNDPFLAN
jgi:Serine/threonine protein kinase